MTLPCAGFLVYDIKIYMQNKIIVLSIAALVVLGAIFVALFPSFFSKQEKVFSLDLEKYEARAMDHPVGNTLLERLKENAKLLEDSNTENDIDGYMGIAFFIRQLGEDNDAILAYREALKLNPHNTLALNNIATSYRDTGDYKSAEEAYRKIIEISPGDVAAYRNLADVYLYQNPDDEEGLLELMQPGIESALNPGDILSYVAVFYRGRGDNGKAIEYFEKFLEFNPGNVAVLDEIEKLRATK